MVETSPIETPLVLSSERLILRDMQVSDVTAFHSYASDPNVIRYTSWGMETMEQSRQFVEGIIQRRHEQPMDNFELAIVEKATNKHIGFALLQVRNKNNKEAELGYFLHKDYWGKGYAVEASKTLVDFGFKSVGLHRIYGTCDPDNRASAHVMEKVGMKFEGRLRDHKWMPRQNRHRDSLQYSILADEWPIKP